MTLHAPAWERRLRRRLRAAVRAAPALWAEYKRRRRRRWNVQDVSGFLFVLILIAWFITLVYADGSPLRLETILILGAAAFGFFRATDLVAGLESRDWHWLLAQYPIARGVAFRHLWRQWLWPGGWLTAMLLAAGGVGLGLQQSWDRVPVLMAAQWAMLHATAVCLAALGPRRWCSRIGLLLLGLAILYGTNPAWGAPFLLELEPGAWWLFPAGWVMAIAHGHWVWLMPAAVASGLSVVGWRRLRAEFLAQPNLDAAPPVAEDDDEPTPQTAEAVVAPAELHAIEDGIRQGQLRQPFAAPPDDALGRLLWRALTPTEREALRLLTDDPHFNLTRQWRNSMIVIGIGTGVMWWLPGQLAVWGVGLTAFISLGSFTRETNGGGRDQAKAWRRWVLYPVRFWDLARAVLKTYFLQLILWSPAALVVGAAVALKWQVPAVIGVAHGAKAAALLLLLIPWSLVVHISPQTNDTRSRHCAVRLVLLITVSAVLTLTGAAVFWLAPWRIAWAGLATGLAGSGWLLGGYGRWFNRMRFDLMPLATNE